jgi:CRP/FNR family cyclic AMP-dependent transcriptional regulator
VSMMSQPQVRRFGSGQVIFQEGDDSKNEAFLVQAGKVVIKKRVKGEERVLRVLGEGELLGELSFFRAAPRSATALAEGDVALAVIPGDRLEHFVRTNPKLAVEIIKRLAQLIWEAEERGKA